MKLLFVVTGVGLGHSTRIDSIISAVKEKEKDAEIGIATFDTAYDYFKNKYPTTKIYGLRLNEGKFKFSLIKTIIKNWIFILIWMRTFFILLKLVIKYKPDRMVIDFEPMAVLVARLMGIKHTMVFNFDRKLLHEYNHAKGFNPDYLLQSEYFIRTYELAKGRKIVTSFFNRGISGNYIYVEPIIRANPEAIWRQGILMRKAVHKKPLLVMMGGSKIGKDLAEAIGRIAKDFSNENFIIFGDIAIKQKNVEVIKFAPNFLKYLSICKGIITLAGFSTLSEILAFKKPALIYPIPNYIEQALNAFEIKRRKLALVRELKEINDNDIKNDIKTFLDNKEKIQERLNEMNVKSNGAEQAAELILRNKKVKEII
ncbi:hypothetical protein J4468_03850 [Candidatus Woesearchaeota archaeon]|nr:hypothetical protein [Candidatus Woesearchaeota archaeon]